MDSIDFSEKLVIVTGVASGIGRATALAFAKYGARVAGIDINPLPDDVNAGGGIDFMKADVSDAAQMSAVQTQIYIKYGHSAEILVSNAGIEFNSVGNLMEMPEDKLREILNVNLYGAINCARAFMPTMPSGGKVIFVSSTQAFMACSPGTSYQASKAALVGLTKALAIEAARQGITVNAVCPAGVATEGMGATRGEESAAGLADYRRHNPVGRRAWPEEIAYPILFLCSPWASYITGATLVIDGGTTSLGMPYGGAGEPFLDNDPDK